ncbi:MAG: hypothetical protein KA807_15710 [Prolixibacteraceae bacterium]|nr:hypothetical protein [Prolixibacteraceae bacterium]
MSQSNIPVFNYTARDFSTIKAELINILNVNFPEINDNTESNNGVVLVEAMAYILDTLHYYLDNRAWQVFLDTVSEKRCAQMIARLLGYTPATAIPAEATLCIGTSANITGTITLPAGTQAYTTVNGKRLIFETVDEITLTSTSKEATVIAHQRETKSETFYSNGLARQKYSLQYTPFATIKSLTINNAVWQQIDGFWNASSSSLVFRVDQVYEQATIVFGNGVQGQIPPHNATIVVEYYTSSGSDGNVVASAIKNLVNSYLYDSNGVPASIYCNNDAAAAGGRKSETVDDIKRNAPRYARLYGRSVCEEDFIYAVESQIAAVQRAGIVTVNNFPALEENTIMIVCKMGPGFDINDYREQINTIFSTTYPKLLTLAHVVAEAEDFLINLNIEWVESEGASREKIEVLMQSALDEYFATENRNFDFGQPVYFSRLVHLLQNIPGVKYVHLITPAADIAMISPKQIAVLGEVNFSDVT